jgi:hypothetical protein
MLTEVRPFRDKGRKLPVLADNSWEMLLKSVEQMLGTVKGYRKAAWKCPKAIGKPLGNS